ncbi:MAG: hypothetical protein AB7F99_07025 [Vicinamibacterales bacterium]
MPSLRILPASLLLAFLSLFLASDTPVGAQAEPGQEPDVTSIFGIWTPGPPPIRLRDFELRGLLAQEDRALLGQAIEGGRVVIRGGERFGQPGESTGARMIILFTGPLKGAASLPLPDAANVAYIQEGDTFRRHPENAPVSTRVIELTPGETPNMVLYRMERLDGESTSGEIFIEVR